MKLLSQQLHGATATQSATIGWKEISCSRTVGSYSATGTLRLTVASGNPLFYFTTLQEGFTANNSGWGTRFIGWTKGWRVQTSGAIDNPTGNGACDFIPRQLEWNAGSIDWAFWTVGTRTITWNTCNCATSSSTTIHRVMVYSERIDLITLSCV